MPPVPTDLAGLARSAASRLFAGESGRALENAAQNESLRVEIEALEPQDGQLRVRGGVANIGDSPLDVSLDAFQFIDETGTTYASDGSTPATLQPGQRVPLDIMLPIGPPRLLQLRVTQPGLAPIDMTLINAEPAAP
jgi:hypothetical protein